MATVFITGANGRLGRATCRAFSDAGHKVRALTRSEPGKIAGVDWVRGDMLDPSSYAEALSGCDAVIHYAAELLEPALMDKTNVTATLQLLHEAALREVRYFCFTSTVAVYGSPRKAVVDENSPIVDPSRSMHNQYYNRPYVVDYARTKAAAELAIRHANPAMVVDIIRPSVVRDRDELLEIGDFGKAAKMFMAPRYSQYILTEDLAQAVIHLMTKGLAETPRVEAFNLADDSNPTYRDILNIAFKGTKDSKYKIPLGLPKFLDMAKYYLSYRKLSIGVPLGYQTISNKKLLATGFKFPVGVLRELQAQVGKKG